MNVEYKKIRRHVENVIIKGWKNNTVLHEYSQATNWMKVNISTRILPYGQKFKTLCSLNVREYTY